MTKTKQTDAKPLLDLIIKATQTQDETLMRLKAMIALPKPEDQWRGVLAVPPGTLMESVLADFRRNTDIPLELPFFSVFAVLAGYLLHSGITAKVLDPDPTAEEIIVYPNIWLLLLSPSGSGKSLAFNVISKSADTEKRIKDTHFQLSGVRSPAALFDLIEKHNNKLAIRDEFGEFYKQLHSGKALEDVKDLLLRVYLHHPITWDTHKDGTRVIDNPSINMIGMAVKDSFCNHLQADDLINGLVQRFLPVIAMLDPKRKMIDFPVYRFHPKQWAWEKLVDSIKFKQYLIPQSSMEGYCTSFRLLFDREVEPSFYRRILWTAHKYALMYHILCGHGDQQEIGAEAYGWAARVLSLHLNDLKELFFSSALSPLQKTLQKVEALVRRLRTEGRPVTARAIVTGVRDIRTVAEARAILQILSEPEDTPTKATV